MLDIQLSLALLLVLVGAAIGYQIGYYQTFRGLRVFWQDYQKNLKKALPLSFGHTGDSDQEEEDPNWDPAWGTRPR